MQQFTVPQFIETEDKIIGAITVRQFVILLVAAILVAICYRVLGLTAFIFMSIFILGIAIILAFVKINGAAFHYFMLNIVVTFKKPRLRVWRKDDTLTTAFEFAIPIKSEVQVETHPAYSSSRLNELALIVDTRGSYQGESDDEVVISRNTSDPNL